LGPLSGIWEARQTVDETALAFGKITVANAEASDPFGWANNIPGTPQHFGEFRSEFRKLGFDPAHPGRRRCDSKP
jgi:hypothetical protein